MWRAAQPLKEEKQNLREKGKQVECRQADTPRTEERASDVRSATTTAGEHFRELRMCASCYLPYQPQMCHVVMPCKLPFDCQE